MQRITLVWGTQQETMLAFGSAGESLSTELIIDVARAEERIPGAVYSIHLRRSDGWTYPASVGLRADRDGEISYILEDSDLAVSGALWITVRADSADDTHAESGTGERRAEWSVIGWVSPGGYEGASPPKPDWVSEVLAFANAFAGISARIALLPPNAKPAAAFVQEPDGMKLVLSLPDAGGAGDGGHAIFSAEDEYGLLALTGASIGDQAITVNGAVYMCVQGDPSQPSAWVALTEDVAVYDKLDRLAEEIESRTDELRTSLDQLEQMIADLDGEITQMEQAVGSITQTLQLAH